MNVVKNILTWSRCRLHRDATCAMEVLYSRYVDEAMLVGSGAYDKLDALREHHRVVLVGLECVIVACW